VSAATPRTLLRTSLLSLIAADVYAGVSLLLNQVFGVSDAWAWGVSVAPALTAFGLLRRWADDLVNGRILPGEVQFSGEKIP